MTYFQTLPLLQSILTCFISCFVSLLQFFFCKKKFHQKENRKNVFFKTFPFKKCSFDQPFLFFWINKKCFLRIYLELKTFSCAKRFSLFSKKCFHSCFLHFKRFLSLPFLTPLLCIPFFIRFPSFLFLILSPGFCLPLGFFHLRFFICFLTIFHFVLFVLFFFFFLEHIFLVPCLSFWLRLLFGLLLSPFTSPVFFGLFNFFEKKKTRFEKSHPFLRIVFLFFNKKLSFLNFSFIVLSLLHKKAMFVFFNASVCNCLFLKHKLCSLCVGPSKSEECSSVFSLASCFSFLSKLAKKWVKHLFSLSLNSSHFFFWKTPLKKTACFMFFGLFLLFSYSFIVFHVVLLKWLLPLYFLLLFIFFSSVLSLFCLLLFSRFFHLFLPFILNFLFWSFYHLYVSLCKTLWKKRYLFRLQQNSLFLSSLFPKKLLFLCFLFCRAFFTLIYVPRFLSFSVSWKWFLILFHSF